ncbi:hypothetical protein VP1G_08185 [Cytospora mali]|uniref:Uncharacterized protein n=1 Tax=Cytospora mali TaxID=578113 RepID=A0A194VAV8_CYTMA|nr:hypothetical protein VP1G_08185 [Valsa mali var. pyri (nom. inval.)]
MVVLKNILAVAIACIAVINSVAGAPAGVKLISTAMKDWTVNYHSGLPPAITATLEPSILAVDGAVGRVDYTDFSWTTLTETMTVIVSPVVTTTTVPDKRQIIDTATAAPYPPPDKRQVTDTATVAPYKPPSDRSMLGLSSGIVTTEGRADIQDMTLSFTTSSTSESFALSSTMFPDPSNFGRPPPVETATTKYTATTTPNFPVVPSIMADGTKLDRCATGTDTTTTALVASAMTVDKVLFPSLDLPGGFCHPPQDGEEHPHQSWPCHPQPTDSLPTPELGPTKTSKPSPLEAKRQASYNFGVPIPEFTDLVLAPWKNFSTANQISTMNVTQAAVHFPTNPSSPPQPHIEPVMSLPRETSSTKVIASCSSGTRKPMSAPTNSTIMIDIDEPTCSVQSISSTETTPVHSSVASETLHWVTVTVTCTTCGQFVAAKTTRCTIFTALPCTTGTCADEASFPPGSTTGLITSETEAMFLPTMTANLPHVVLSIPDNSEIVEPLSGTFTTEKTTLETSIRSTQA